MTAKDPAIRGAFRKIAVEEAEHADLAWCLHGELRNMLDQKARTELDEALESALRSLAGSAVDLSQGWSSSPDEARHARERLGLPNAEVEAVLRAALVAELRQRAAIAA